jgi:hypothetical protein
MTRNLLARASDHLQSRERAMRSPRSRRAGICLESLEARLSLSAVSGTASPTWDLNPQPLPPGYMAEVSTMQSNVVLRKHVGTEIVGNHIGTSVVGAHIGTNIVGNHIGYSMIQGNHIG